MEKGISTATYLRRSEAFTGFDSILLFYATRFALGLDLHVYLLQGSFGFVLICKETDNESSTVGETRPLGSNEGSVDAGCSRLLFYLILKDRRSRFVSSGF